MRKRMLVIEDERDIADLIRLHLEDLNHRVTIARDGETGLRVGLADSWDLVILDLRLPGIDGLEICRRLRQKSEYVPILMLTSKSSELDRVVGLEVGADDYVTKPFSMVELIARIQAVLRRARSPLAEERLEIDGLVMDLTCHRVTRNGRPIRLGPTEIRLLRFLIEHPGRVFSRDSLRESVWGRHIFVELRTVDVHVRRLRAAVNAPR